MIFVVGAVVGSFLNVCIYRLPLEKSALWPLSSRCGHCFQPIRTRDNLPLLSYWLLRGRCRTCGAAFSIRYFFIELITALGFVGLFYLDAIENVRAFDERVLGSERFQLACFVTFLLHAILFSFLLTVSMCDFDQRTIPLSLTVTGTLVGLIAAMLMPWPWPYTPAQAVPQPPQVPLAPVIGMNPWVYFSPRQGVYPWPVWGPLPSWLAPGSWLMGLATALAGMLAGTGLLRVVRFLFGLGMGPEYMEDPDPEAPPRGKLGEWYVWAGRVGGKTLGLGDADLMMMAGAFLGWQPILAAFFLGVFPGMILGMIQIFRRGENALPFGPALAIGVMIASLAWPRIGPQLQFFYFNPPFLIGIVVFSCLSMLIAGYCLRIYHLFRGSDKE